MLCGWCRLQKRLCQCKFLRWPRPRQAGLAPVGGGGRDHIPAHVVPGRLAPPRDRIPELVAPPHPGLAEAGRVPATPPCLGARPGLQRDTQPAGWAGLGGRVRRPELSSQERSVGAGRVQFMPCEPQRTCHCTDGEQRGSPFPRSTQPVSPAVWLLPPTRSRILPGRVVPHAVLLTQYMPGSVWGSQQDRPTTPGGGGVAGRGRVLGAAARRDRVSTNGP